MWNERGKTRDTYKHHRRGYTSPGLFDTFCFYCCQFLSVIYWHFPRRGKRRRREEARRRGAKGNQKSGLKGLKLGKLARLVFLLSVRGKPRRGAPHRRERGKENEQDRKTAKCQGPFSFILCDHQKYTLLQRQTILRIVDRPCAKQSTTGAPGTFRIGPVLLTTW